MLTNFELRNFKGFRTLRLTDLKRINIVVGRSASGKTALLEALRLALGGTPQLGYQLQANRGVNVNAFPPSRDQFESIWSSLFFDFDISKTIDFSLGDQFGRKASLEIFFDKERSFSPVVQQFPGMTVPLFTTSIVPIVFRRKLYDGEESSLTGTLLQQGQIHFENGKDIEPAAELFQSFFQFNSVQVANWFSQLSVANSETETVNLVKSQFPEIENLSIQAFSNAPALYATLRHVSRKMPLSLVSSGINKFASLLLAIKIYSGGSVLIDEIENGIYYKMFHELWSSIFTFAKSSNTQLFLSTHSWECLRGALEVIQKYPDEFSMIQVYQSGEISEATVTPGNEVAAAIASDVEVRR